MIPDSKTNTIVSNKGRSSPRTYEQQVVSDVSQRKTNNF